MNEEAYNKTMEPLIHKGNTPPHSIKHDISGDKPEEGFTKPGAMQKRCTCF